MLRSVGFLVQSTWTSRSFRTVERSFGLYHTERVGGGETLGVMKPVKKLVRIGQTQKDKYYMIPLTGGT